MVLPILFIVVLAIIAASAFDKCPLWPAVLIVTLVVFYGQWGAK